MGNITLPTPVALAGGGICLLGGYLLGTVVGPDAPSRTTAVVDSYDDGDGRLCLSGKAVSGLAGASEDGTLCGTWRRSVADDGLPEPGDRFRFVTVLVDQPPSEDAEGDGEGEGGSSTMIYGDVVG